MVFLGDMAVSHRTPQPDPSSGFTSHHGIESTVIPIHQQRTVAGNFWETVMVNTLIQELLQLEPQTTLSLWCLINLITVAIRANQHGFTVYRLLCYGEFMIFV